MTFNPDARTYSLKDRLDRLVIPDLSEGLITEISADQVKLLMDKFSNLAMMMVHIGSYADSEEGRIKLEEMGTKTVDNTREIGKNVKRDDPEQILAFRKKFLIWLPQQLRYIVGILKKYYFPSKKYKAERIKWQTNPDEMPPSLKGILEAYLKIT